jgi:hypothetical protein
METSVTREEWLGQMADAIFADPELLGGHEIPPIKLSVGFPPRSRGGKVIGACMRRSVSEGRYNEIFISPTISDSILVAATLLHELIHALDDCESGHKGHFAKVAAKVGLNRPYTATTPNDELAARLNDLIDLIGPIPHAQVNLKAVKKQGTRQKKVHCTNCGWQFHTSRKQIDAMTMNVCLSCGEHDTLQAETE